METHYITTSLRRKDGTVWGVDSRARWATEPTGACLLFVHGFGGNSIGTWLEFPRFFPMEEAAGGIDLIFFGYDSKYETTARSASRLLELLRAIHTSPAPAVVNPSLPTGVPPRSTTFRYDRVVICAHSLGAVVSRLALLEAARIGKRPAWLKNNQLIFFAPAHKGARVIALASKALSGISLPLVGLKFGGQLVEVALKSRMRVLSELEIGSQTLKDLEDATVQALKRPELNAHLRAHVAHAVHDQVVMDGSFAQDHETVFVEKKGHMNVCKPALGYLRPIELLAKWMGLAP